MDILKQELERKKKELKSSSCGGRRYRKASDRFKEVTKEADEEDETTASKKRKLSSTTEQDNPESTQSSLSPEVEGLDEAGVTKQFRKLGLEIKLFGEQSLERKERLQKALRESKETVATLSAKDEFRLDKEHRIRNPFLAQDTKETGTNAKDRKASKQARKEIKEDSELPSDPFKRIYKYFRNLLCKWEDELEQRPDSAKSSMAGRNEQKTYEQCKDYIRPLFKECKKNQLDEGILKNLNRIIDFCIQGEFVKAHDAYLDIAIGRSPWPIGVTQVGIHARTGRSKIESQNVAHVMNSELQRKYLTSVKRLMTYAQNKRDDVLHSKKVS